MPGFATFGKPWFGNGTSLGWTNAVLEVICSVFKSSYLLGGYSLEAEVEIDRAVTICLGDGASGTFLSLSLGFLSPNALVLAVTITIGIREQSVRHVTRGWKEKLTEQNGKATGRDSASE